MARHFCWLSAVGAVPLLLASMVCAQDEMCENPYYKFWAASKPGATAVHLEHTKLGGPEGKLVPGGVDEKRIAYKLVEIDKDRAIVEMVVTEQDFLGYVQAAPTRYIYPAKWKKSYVEQLLSEDGTKIGEETIQVAGKQLACKTVSGTLKGPNGEQIEYKLWLADVPGSIAKQVRTTRQKGELVAETTSTLQSSK